MIHLFTDFGWLGPYVGEMKAVIARELPNVNLVDLMHDAPMFNPKASAYLLAALSKRFVAGDFCLAVVDPGVGDQTRRAIVVEADGVHYVGPDNGLFALLIRNAKAVTSHEILWRPAKLSDSFHGRDVFAPVVSRLVRGLDIETCAIPTESLIGHEYPDELGEIIYLDHYGNAVTGLSAGHYTQQAQIQLNRRTIEYARTFSSVQPGEPFWYANSMGLVEIAVNGKSASEILKLSIGSMLAMKA